MRRSTDNGPKSKLEVARDLESVIGALNDVSWWLGRNERDLLALVDDDLSRMVHKLHCVSCLFLAVESTNVDERSRALYFLSQTRNPETLPFVKRVLEDILVDERAPVRDKRIALQALKEVEGAERDLTS